MPYNGIDFKVGIMRNMVDIKNKSKGKQHT